jgi:hypothetical protein
MKQFPGNHYFFVCRTHDENHSFNKIQAQHKGSKEKAAAMLGSMSPVRLTGSTRKGVHNFKMLIRKTHKDHRVLSKSSYDQIMNSINMRFDIFISRNGNPSPNQTEFVNDLDIQPQIKYFSVDTHTIYPPCLEFRWRDYIFNTGSSTNTILNTPQATISVGENPGIFYPESINRFRINCRPTYPTRVFQTASLYSKDYYLPTASYYAIKDLDTNEYIIDFDNQYTQLSADEKSSYFTLYMNGLQPERYYEILIKTIISGNTLIFNDNFYFKIVNG